MSETSLPTKPSEVEYILAHSIGKKLIERYQPEFGEQKASFLAVAILNHAFLMPTDSQEALSFSEDNKVLIDLESRSICYHRELSDAFSLLYSFMLIILGPTNFERTRELSDRASDLLIELRTPEEICNTSDPWVFLAYVRKYALELIDRKISN
jgi:hypothetical protein